jgi:hypothetical protein
MIPVCVLVIPRCPVHATGGLRANAELFSAQAELVRGLFDPDGVALYINDQTGADCAALTAGIPALPLLKPQLGAGQAWPWRPGFAEALAAAHGRYPNRGLLLADASRLALDETILRQFLDTLKDDLQRPLMSVRECRDHPCQLLRFWRVRDCVVLTRLESTPRMHGPAKSGSKQKASVLAEAWYDWPERVRWTWERQASGEHMLRREPERTCFVTCQCLDEAGLRAHNPRGDLGPGRGPLPLGNLPDSVRTLFITEHEEDLRSFQRAEPMQDAPGLWSRLEDGSIRNEQTGQLVAGRQDFPSIVELDPLLVYVPARLVGAGLPRPEACRPWTLPTGLPETAPADELGRLKLWAYLEARRSCS